MADWDILSARSLQIHDSKMPVRYGCTAQPSWGPRARLGGPVEKMSFFQMAPGSILSTQIPSDRSQYDVYKFSFKKIGWKVSVGGVKADIFAH